MILDGPEQCKIPSIYEDFSNGSLLKNHELLACDKTALQLIMYYDDMNLTNPLTNKVHKLGFVYYNLVNIHVKYRSKLKSIHLLAICKTALLKKYGIKAVFSPIVDELKCLHDGNNFHIFGGIMWIRGYLLCSEPTLTRGK